MNDTKAKIAAAKKTLEALTIPEQEALDLAELKRLEEQIAKGKSEQREREEDARFTEFSARATGSVRLGQVRLEPGQAIFRQIDLTTKRQIEAMPDGPDKSAAVEAEFRAAIQYPPAAELAKWELGFPGVIGDILSAWGEHNSAVRRIRAGK